MVEANASDREFVCGWFGVVKNCLMPNVLQNNVVSFEIKALPLSVNRDIPLHRPQRATILSKIALTIVSADKLDVAINSCHMLVLSIITRMYLLPSDSGTGPRLSQCQRIHG